MRYRLLSAEKEKAERRIAKLRVEDALLRQVARSFGPSPRDTFENRLLISACINALMRCNDKIEQEEEKCRDLSAQQLILSALEVGAELREATTRIETLFLENEGRTTEGTSPEEEYTSV